MNKKQLTILLWSSFGFMLAVSIILGSFLVKKINDRPTIVKEVTVDVAHKEGETGDPLHEHDKDLDIDSKESDLSNNDSLIVDSIVFSGFNEYPGAIAENTGPLLLDSTKVLLLIRQYGGLIYVYNTELERSSTIAEFADYATFSDDQKYVFFTKYSDPLENTGLELFVHSLDTFQQEKIAAIPDGLTIEDILYKDGVVTYVAKDMNYSAFVTKEIVIPDFRKQMDASLIEPPAYPEVEGLLIMRDGHKYGYNFSSNKVYEIVSGQKAIEKLVIPEPSTIGFMASFDISSNGEYALIYALADGSTNVLRTSKGVSDLFKEPINSQFLSNDVLLVQDATNLHLYNVKTNKKTPFLSNVARFHIHNHVLSIQDLDGSIQNVSFDEKK